MQHTFSSEFLKILPPATNFGEAWEALCLSLLQAEHGDRTIMILGPPDRGIDIIQRKTNGAYQCKSSERGIYGKIDPQSCIDSFARALQARRTIGWERYLIALNAPLTGDGLSRILDFAESQGIDKSIVDVLPHDYWAALCDKHRSVVEHRFDYRVFVSEAEVRELMAKARYYDRYIEEAAQSIRNNPLQVSVGNNRTPVELVISFSSELTIEHLLDVVKTKLGVSLDWANFPDLGTSCGPSLSLTAGRVSQAFKLKLSELTPEQRAKLQLWIQLIWRDELQTSNANYDGTLAFYRFINVNPTYRLIPTQERGSATLERMGAIVQAGIWRSLVAGGAEQS